MSASPPGAAAPGFFVSSEHARPVAADHAGLRVHPEQRDGVPAELVSLRPEGVHEAPAVCERLDSRLGPKPGQGGLAGRQAGEPAAPFENGGGGGVEHG